MAFKKFIPTDKFKRCKHPEAKKEVAGGALWCSHCGSIKLSKQWVTGKVDKWKAPTEYLNLCKRKGAK